VKIVCKLCRLTATSFALPSQATNARRISPSTATPCAPSQPGRSAAPMTVSVVGSIEMSWFFDPIATRIRCEPGSTGSFRRRHRPEPCR
jgi:hypothetical protein